MSRKILNEAVSRAVAIVGSQQALATEISKLTGRSIKQGQVWAWLYKNGKPDPTLCIPIEKVTKGIVSRYALRSDVFGQPQDQIAA